MKKRKRIRLDCKKQEKKKEWQKVKQAQNFEKIYRLLDTHFDMEKHLEKSPEGIIKIDFEVIIETLSCEQCSHFEMECKGERLKGKAVIECLEQSKHESCQIGIIYDNDWDYVDETYNP